MLGRGGCCCRTVSPTMGYPMPMMGYDGRGAGVGIIAIAILILIALGVIF